jgi:hypothetical protein
VLRQVSWACRMQKMRRRCPPAGDSALAAMVVLPLTSSSDLEALGRTSAGHCIDACLPFCSVAGIISLHQEVGMLRLTWQGTMCRDVPHYLTTVAIKFARRVQYCRSIKFITDEPLAVSTYPTILSLDSAISEHTLLALSTARWCSSPVPVVLTLLLSSLLV